MKILRSHLCPSEAPFYGIIPGMQVVPLGSIQLPITSNFRKELLAIEVEAFPSTYNTLLGRPCYVKFMEIPYYAFLKIKMCPAHMESWP
jgi:hypothetical protein